MKTSYSWKLLPYLRPYWRRFLWALAQVFLIAGFKAGLATAACAKI